MVFKGKNPGRSKILLNGKILEQVSHLSYRRRDISFKFDKDTVGKVNRYQTIRGTTGRILGRKARKETQVKCYKVTAVASLIYGSESWTTKKDQVYS